MAVRTNLNLLMDDMPLSSESFLLVKGCQFLPTLFLYHLRRK